MKQKRRVQQHSPFSWLVVVVLAILLAVIAVKVFLVQPGLPVEEYAPGLYLADEPLHVYQWYIVTTDEGMRLPACALSVSDGQTYLSIDPDMTGHCGVR